MLRARAYVPNLNTVAIESAVDAAVTLRVVTPRRSFALPLRCRCRRRRAKGNAEARICRNRRR